MKVLSLIFLCCVSLVQADTNAVLRVIAAFNERDVDAFIAGCETEFRLTLSGHEVITSREELEAWFESRFGGGFAAFKSIRVETEPTSLQSSGGVVSGEAGERHELQNGKSFDFDTRWTATLGEGGKLRSLHLSGNVFNNDMATGQKRMWKQVMIFSVLTAAAVGALLGAFAAGGARRHR